MRAAIESLTIERKFSSASDFVTVSAGSATVIPTNAIFFSIGQLVHTADMALYKTQILGRNRVETVSEIIIAGKN